MDRMRLSTQLAILALIAVTLPATMAQARDNAGYIQGTNHQIKLFVGGIQGQKSDTQATNDNLWYLISVAFDLQKPSSARALDLSTFLEGGGNRNRERLGVGQFQDSDLSFWGAGLAMTLRVSPPNPHFCVYATAGVGGYILERKVTNVYQYISNDPFGPDTQEEFKDSLEDRHRLSFGYKLGGGIQFGRSLFLEMAYYDFGHLANTRYGGIGATFGIRL